MNISNINTWSDDHLPCVSFTVDANTFEVWWTDKTLAGRLEMAGEGDVTLEVALKKFPDLLTIINNPYTTPESDSIEVEDDRYAGGVMEYQIDIGYVKVYPATKEAA